MKNKINERLDTNTNTSQFVKVVYTLITTNLINKNIVRNHIADTPLACPLIPSIRFMALIHSIDHITKNITKNHCGIFHTKSQQTNSCQAQISHIQTAKIAHHIWASNLIRCGTLKFTFHIYPNSSTSSTNIIGKTHRINPKNILFENISGKSTKTTKIRLR